MKKVFSVIPALIFFLTFISCTGDESVTVPVFENDGLLKNSSPISSGTSYLIEGVYSVENGSENFGRNVVIKFTEKSFSIFTGKNFAYFVLK
ncbi:MAG: hypothetical protein Q8S39_14200, partial [Ignavibacteria bacterium]|nr:hypothetical protein [Ignavibacteria bacterium]